MNDCSYDAAVKDDILRDILVFDVRSDKVCKGAIVLGNTLAFNQICNLAKIEESTKAHEGYYSK